MERNIQRESKIYINNSLKKNRKNQNEMLIYQTNEELTR
jgi:hypothetical protein